MGSRDVSKHLMELRAGDWVRFKKHPDTWQHIWKLEQKHMPVSIDGIILVRRGVKKDEDQVEEVVKSIT